MATVQSRVIDLEREEESLLDETNISAPTVGNHRPQPGMTVPQACGDLIVPKQDHNTGTMTRYVKILTTLRATNGAVTWED